MPATAAAPATPRRPGGGVSGRPQRPGGSRPPRGAGNNSTGSSSGGRGGGRGGGGDRGKPARGRPSTDDHEILFQKFFKSVGPRTYAAQVKRAANGNHYLVLMEGKRDDKTGEVRKTRVFVYSEDFVEFFRLVKSAAEFIKANPVSEETRLKREKFWQRQGQQAPGPRPPSRHAPAAVPAPRPTPPQTPPFRSPSNPPANPPTAVASAAAGSVRAQRTA